MPHNESLADPQVVKDIENNFTNPNGHKTIDAHVSISTRSLLYGAVGVVAGVVVGRALGNYKALRYPMGTAKDVAKTVSEVVE